MAVDLTIKTVLSEQRFDMEIRGPLEKSVKHIKLNYGTAEEKADLYLSLMFHIRPTR